MNLKLTELLRLWIGCLLLVGLLGGTCRLLIETDGMSQAGRARFAQKCFGYNHPVGRLLASR